MIPDFNKATIDTIAKRAAYICSNPDCHTQTVGPGSEQDKSILLGEAAHIFGARPNSKRYSTDMTDTARSEITNAIWLCRNCHKLIDTDEVRYPSSLLFKWREIHDEYVASNLGSQNDKIRFNQNMEKLEPYRDYPSIIKRIIIDKPDGYEWRLAAELLRYLNKPLFKKIYDLKHGMYLSDQIFLDEKNILGWISDRLKEATNLTPPLISLLDRLTLSFGPPGKEGDIEEIHHTCILINKYIDQIIRYEEKIYFANVPEKYEKIVSLLKDNMSSQVEKLSKIPIDLDNVVSLINKDHGGTNESPKIIENKIVFETRPGWEEEFEEELRKLRKKTPSTRFTVFWIIGFILLLIFIF